MRKDQETTAAATPQMAAKIIQLPRKPRGNGQGRSEIIDPLRRLQDEDEHRRTLQNLAAAVVIAALIASGLWLIDHLRSGARSEACLEAGHRHCLPHPLPVR